MKAILIEVVIVAASQLMQARTVGYIFALLMGQVTKRSIVLKMHDRYLGGWEFSLSPHR